MNQRPEVSIILPALSVDRYLLEALTSISLSRFEDFEVVIVAPREKLEAIGALCEKLDLKNKTQLVPDSGPNLPSALNLAIKASRGKYLARMDADDRMSSLRLEKQKAILDSDPDCSVVGSQVNYICRHGNTTGRSRYPSLIYGGRLSDFQNDSQVAHPAVMMRASDVNKIGGYDVRFQLAEDLELWNRMIKIGSFRNLKDTLLDYRQHVNQISNKRVDEIRRFALCAVWVNAIPNSEARNFPVEYLSSLDFEILLGQFLADERVENLDLVKKFSKLLKEILAAQTLSRIRGSLSTSKDFIDMLRVISATAVSLRGLWIPTIKLLLRYFKASVSIRARTASDCTLCEKGNLVLEPES